MKGGAWEYPGVCTHQCQEGVRVSEQARIQCIQHPCDSGRSFAMHVRMIGERWLEVTVN